MHERKLDWDVTLLAVLYAYRTKAHSVLKISPYELLLGIEPLGEEKDMLQRYGKKIGFEKLTLLQQRNGNQQYQVESVEEETKGGDGPVIDVGDKVLMIKHNRKNKLEPNYRNKLYTVLVKKSNNVYTLANEKVIWLKRAVNGSQIRKYYTRLN